MNTQGNTHRNSPPGENANLAGFSSEPTQDSNLMEFMKSVMKSQQEHIRLLRDGLIATNQAANATVDRAIAPREPKAGGVFNFRMLQPSMFTGTEESLVAEQWLKDMANLLEAANVQATYPVKVIKVQLTVVAHTWWLSEEVKLPGQVSWKQFSDSFLEQFFLITTRREMQKRFVNLRQGDMSVDRYAAEFLRLNRFAPKLVKDEEDKASQLQQGLGPEIRKFLSFQQLDTYNQVLTVAH